MEEVTIENLSDYISFIDKLPVGYLSRGQWKDLPLLPSAMRRDDKGMILYSPTTRQSFIDDFKINSARYVDSSHFNEFEWLVYAQHFGVPTCLLDFTYSHLISAMFAVENAFNLSDEDEENSVIWFVDPVELNRQAIKRAEIINISYESVNTNKIQYPIAITSKKNNPRIAAQNGLFVYFKDDMPLNEVNISDEILKKVKIPHTCGKKILKSLFIMGMRFVDIYPELSSISKDILLKNKIIRNQEAENE